MVALIEGEVVLSEPATVALLQATPALQGRAGSQQFKAMLGRDNPRRDTRHAAGTTGRMKRLSDGAVATPDFCVVQDLIDDGKLSANATLAAILLL